MRAIVATVHQLSGRDLCSEVGDVRDRMYEKFGQEVVDSRIKPYDWARWSLVVEEVRGARSVLDVGTGQGTFINALAATESIERLVGIDIRDYSLYVELYPGFERIMVDAEAMEFPDGAFDVVVGMEIIEHQPDGKMERVLQELRRVARKRLLVTVPFCEPLPLPKYHKQHFDAERVRTMFPRASPTLLLKDPVTRVPWLLLDEPQGKRRRL